MFNELKQAYGNNGVAAELPRYRCHKEVWALKIKAIDLAPKPTIDELEKLLASEDDTKIEILPSGQVYPAGTSKEVGAMVTPENSRYGAFPVTRGYLSKHNPQVGGYYVVYKDGYQSYSPADAFEEGYTKI